MKYAFLKLIFLLAVIAICVTDILYRETHKTKTRVIPIEYPVMVIEVIPDKWPEIATYKVVDQNNDTGSLRYPNGQFIVGDIIRPVKILMEEKQIKKLKLKPITTKW